MEEKAETQALANIIEGELMNGKSALSLWVQGKWIKLIIAFCGLGVLLPCVATAGDIYLAVRKDGQTGSGSVHDPFDAGTAAKYDAILARFRGNTNFHYAAGTYQTTGGCYITRPTANSNCHHYGAGIDRTIIQLIGATIPTREGVIFYNDYNVSVTGFEVHDLTLDCNATGNPLFANGFGAVGAINVIGNNLLFDNLKIEHFGTGKRGVECFPVFSYGFAGGNFSNIVLENSIFTNPVSGNKDGLTAAAMGAASNATIDGSIINCQFTNLKSDFSYSHAFAAPLCEGNQVTNCEIGFYLEPIDWQYGTWTIRNNRFTNVYVAALVNWHPTATLNTIQFENNIVLLTADPRRGSAAFGAEDSGLAPGGRHPTISNVIFSNNQVGPAQQSNANIIFTYGISLLSRQALYSVANVVLQGNTIDLLPIRAMVISPKTVVQRWSQSGNVDSQKAPIHVMDPNGNPL